MLTNKWTWVVVGVIILLVLIAAILKPELAESIEERQARCEGYFKRMDENHESARAIIPEADYQFCLDYSKNFYKESR